MTDLAHEASSTTIFDVSQPRRADLGARDTAAGGSRRPARPQKWATKTVGTFVLCALVFWLGAEAVEWGVTAGEGLVEDARSWLFELRRGLAARGH